MMDLAMSSRACVDDGGTSFSMQGIDGRRVGVGRCWGRLAAVG